MFHAEGRGASNEYPQHMFHAEGRGATNARYIDVT